MWHKIEHVGITPIRTIGRSYLPSIELGTTTILQKKNLNSPDETRSFDNGKVELTTLSKTKRTLMIDHKRYIDWLT